MYFANGLCLFKQIVLYTVLISRMVFRKSVGSSVYNANKNAYSVINSGMTTLISIAIALHPLQEN